jgi:hypothetical protein
MCHEKEGPPKRAVTISAAASAHRIPCASVRTMQTSEPTVEHAIRLGESAVWLSNSRNNFAPFAGFMLRGYEKKGPLESAGEDIDEPIQDALADGETPTQRTN